VRLLLIVLVAVLLAPAAAAADTIEVAAHLQNQNVAGLPPKGRSGNAYSAVWIVRDRHARTIGDVLLDCRWVNASLRLCVGQLSMPLGTLALIGASRTSLIGQLAVVGGTGVYAGASGTVLFDAIGLRRYIVTANYHT